jgi:uncharacterized protein (DUF885 family)
MTKFLFHPLSAAAVVALVLVLPQSFAAEDRAATGDAAFRAVHDRYVVEFLRRNPTVSTYLGGSGLDPSLQDAEGRLRDHSVAALAAEDRWLGETRAALQKIEPVTLSPGRRIDRDVALAQIEFLLHQHQVRRYQERAVDTYVGEPFRSLDWQLQGMTPQGGAAYGTRAEWEHVVQRVRAIPRFLAVAREQLLAGVKSGNTPDIRMARRDGIETAEANANYFDHELAKLAGERLARDDARTAGLLSDITTASGGAAAAYREMAAFFRTTFFEVAPPATKAAELKPKAALAGDRFAFGETEYDWALRNNLRVAKTAAQLYEESWSIVQATRAEMIKVARQVGAQRRLKLPADDQQAVRAVMDALAGEFPKTDAEMVAWYREAGVRLVAYARKTGMFDVPADYRLDVVETPPPLRAAIEGAAYYPAPPFKPGGVGRFYVTTSGNDDLEVLKENNRAALADLAAHEGFPGHDWHYRVMTEHRSEIAGVRWLTPGAVEDSSAMWEDSMAAEGWALYSEALMAEPQPGAPEGFYTPEERLYQLQGQLYRDLRVRIDTGLHTGRLGYNDAVELFSEIVHFQPRVKAGETPSAAKAASLKSAEAAIYRYSKWPTQAITYRLGKAEILALRADAQRQLGPKFSAKTFHLLFMRQGTIPARYFREELMRALGAL